MGTGNALLRWLHAALIAFAIARGSIRVESSLPGHWIINVAATMLLLFGLTHFIVLIIIDLADSCRSLRLSLQPHYGVADRRHAERRRVLAHIVPFIPRVSMVRTNGGSLQLPSITFVRIPRADGHPARLIVDRRRQERRHSCLVACTAGR